MNRLTKYICGAAHGKCGRTIEEASKAKNIAVGNLKRPGALTNWRNTKIPALNPMKSRTGCGSLMDEKDDNHEAD